MDQEATPGTQQSATTEECQMKIHGIDFPFLSLSNRDMPKNGWPNSDGEGPGFQVLACKRCGWEVSVCLGGDGGYVERSLAGQMDAAVFHGDRCGAGEPEPELTIDDLGRVVHVRESTDV